LSRFQRERKRGSQSGLRVASLHWYVKKRATQNTLQKKTRLQSNYEKERQAATQRVQTQPQPMKIDNNYLLKLLYRQCN